jgi:hypothetical protein
VKVYIPLSSIWSSQYTLEEFIIENARLNYEISDAKKSERANVSKVFFRPDEEEEFDLSNIKFVLSALSLKNSSISIFLEDLNHEYQLTGINQDSRLVLDSSIVRLSTKTKIDTIKMSIDGNEQLRSFDDNIDLNLSYNIGNKQLDIKNTSFNILNIPGELESQLKIEKTKNGYIRFFGEKVKIEELIANIDPSLLEKISKATGELRYNTQIEFKNDELSYHGNLSINEGFIGFKEPKAEIEKIATKVNFSDEIIEINETEIIAEGQKLSLNANIKLSEEYFDIKSKFNLKANLQKLKKFNPLLPERFKFESGEIVINLSIDDKINKATTKTEKVNYSNIIPNFSSQVEFKQFAFNTVINKSHLFKINGNLTANKNQIKLLKVSANDEVNSYYVSSLSLVNYMDIMSTDLKKKASLTGFLFSKNLIADHYLPDKKKKTKEGKISEKEKPRNELEKFAILAKIDITATAKIEQFQFEKIKLQNMNATIYNNNQYFKAKITQLDIYEGSSNGNVIFDYNRIPLKVSTDFNLKKMNSNTAFTELIEIKDKIYGKLNSSGKLIFTLDDTLGVNTKSVTGDVSMEITDGKIANVEALKKLGSQLKVFKFDTLFLNSWTYGATIENETVYLRNTVIKGNDYRIVSEKGTIGFNKKMNIPLEFIISSKKSEAYEDQSDGLVRQLLPYLRNSNGELEMQVKLLGAVNSPDVKLVWDKAQKRLETDAKKKLEKKAKNLLKKLFN